MQRMGYALGAAISLVSGAMTAGTAAAQGFPSKTVTLVVPFPAGGPSDVNARTLAAPYQKRLQQTVIVENVGGVSGANGVQKVLDAPADGHTQLVGTPLELIFAPLGLAAVKYKPQDMRLAAISVSTSLLVLVRKDAPVSGLEELVAWARSNALSAGNPGHGSLYHLATVKFAQQAEATLTHVSYKGGAQILTDLAGGHIDMAVYPLAGAVLGMLKEGRFKAIGIAAPRSHPLLPDVPPVSSHPAFAGFNFDIWVGVQVPRATPEPVVQRINRDVYDSIVEPEFRNPIEGHGAQVSPRRSLAELDQLYVAEFTRYRALAQTIGLKPE